MKFSQLAGYFSKIESTPSRNEMTAILAELLKESSQDEIDTICYLSLGRLAPLYEGIEFNLAEKMLIKILAQAYGYKEAEVKKLYKKKGDLGEVAEELSAKLKVKNAKLSVNEVYDKLREIAEVSGAGSQEKKIVWMANLLRELDPLSARYVVRIPVKKLRLGFMDKTILDALSVAEVGDKSARPDIERAYNVSADIGKIARVVKEKGIKGLAKIKVEVGTPIRMASAERLSTTKDILEKMGGKTAAEPKFDGFRVQVHLDKSRKLKERESSEQLALMGGEIGGPWVKIFSRNLEDTTAMFPEIVEAVQKLPVKSLIFEGEAIACKKSTETEEFEPFQETAKRKRKYGVKEKAAELPLKVFAFDLLFIDGKNTTQESYKVRRGRLERLIKGREDTILLAEEQEFTDPQKLKKFFMKQLERGLEGIMTKRLDGVYQAGVRNFNWVKLKRVEKSHLSDTIDCVVLGYYRGRGKRAQFGIGGFLAAVYDDKKDMFVTISRVGSGLTDEEWQEMRRRVDKLRVSKKPLNVLVEKELTPDVWAVPSIVVAIRADEITRSPLHTASRVKRDGVVKPGLALRFPRLMAFRDDKDPEQATTVKEVEKLFKQQRQRRS
ncbi:MAG: ATP-dependent DNA ligase [Patescibacteria group bacterium]|nr:MAG: ATP-dependent DNA ligase [Patescibacteria group bacterium]